MTTVDYLLTGAVLLSMLFGSVRGFLRESVALLGWLVGLWLAWRYASIVEPYLGGALAGTPLQVWVARMIVLLAAPKANDYYPKLGFEHNPRAWVLRGR